MLPLKRCRPRVVVAEMRCPAGASKVRGPRYLLPQPTQLIERGLVAPSPLPGTPHPQRSSPARYLRKTDVDVLHAEGSSGWRRQAPVGPAPPHMPSPRGRHGRPGPGRCGDGALSRAESPGGGGGALSSAGGAAGGPPQGLARGGVETPPSRVEVGPSSSLREPASRPSCLVDPGDGIMVRVMARYRNQPPVVPPVSSRGNSRELSLSRGHPGWGAWNTSACPE